MQKPPSYQVLSYEKWRKEIFPAIQNSFLLSEEIADDDLHEFEDVDIYHLNNINIKAIHVYLHNLENWFGVGNGEDNDEEQNQFRL